ncbi:carboxyl-terminal processing protease [Oceanospirillum multiglobuliferum]|uniref:carboxy terminal-processing peptidase n=1 Tax=Oceanospirillum multiglobuliferum TaxID=64969 RepID=UPI000999AAEE|nr:carboxy terminal-processing peptidase [Oceanospirillum multiglobuliferum]SJZ52647.1 carboxyl-terminal processing protease [Oceanospirillum multiglobuliferum]
MLSKVIPLGLPRALILTFLSIFSVYSFAENAAVGQLSASQEQRQAAKDVVERLGYGHYREIKLDDALSAQILDHYLKLLDGSKAYFTQAEIDNYEQYRNQLDDDLQKGDLQAAFEIYNTYQKKLVKRIEQQLVDLESFPDDFVFDGKETLLLDRTDSPWAATEAELNKLWKKRLTNSLLSLKLSGKTVAEARKTLTRRLQSQLTRVQQTRDEDVFQVFMNAYTQLYDPHTQYLSPRSSETFNIRMKLSLDGIGALLQSEDEFTKVVSLVPGGPADLAGELKPADRIIGVGQENGEIVDVIGWRLDEVVDLIRDPRASTVRLQVIPANAADNSQSKEIAIVRNTVKLEDQAAKKSIVTLDQNGQNRRIGVIDIPAFYVDFEAWRQGAENYRSTTRDVARLITELEAEGIDGLIIDLRNNGGGALQEANSLVGLFIDRGPTVQVRSAEGRIDILGDSDNSIVYNGPLAVLVNRLSASASEIFAGAIQDYQRGVVIGGQTFGKGTVQSVTPLDHGQLKLTRAKFYRISGESTQHKGVVPDIMFPNLFDHKEVGESALEFALPWDQVKQVPHKFYVQLPTWLPALRENHQKRSLQDPDLIFLAEQTKLIEQTRSIKSISLNEQTRQAETKRIEAQQLALENQRRKAKGLELIKELNEHEDKKDDPNQDAELVESGRIILDMIKLNQTAVTAQQ